MLTVNHWAERVVPNEKIGEVTEGAEGVCNRMGRAMASTGQTPGAPRGLDHQPKNTHGGTHGSGCNCGRAWPCCTSVGRQALGPEGV